MSRSKFYRSVFDKHTANMVYYKVNKNLHTANSVLLDE